jgi:hypothetical protein
MSVATARSQSFIRDNQLRLPVVRNRSRLLAGIGVVAICALLIATLYNRAGQRTYVLVLSHDISTGQVIERSDLKSVGIAANSPVATVKTPNARTIMGKTATSNLSAGTILTPSAVANVAQTAPGQAVVGAALKPGQFPTSLHVGDRVLAVITPSTGTSTPDGNASSTPIDATVSDVGTTDANTGTTSVSLTMSASDAPSVATAGASSNLSLVVLGQ